MPGARLLDVLIMDLSKIIQDLCLQRDKIARTITELETLGSTGHSDVADVAKRRGRKSMGAEERQEVSIRMKKYWASRRKDREPEKR